MRPLTNKERAFVEGVLAGESNADAWAMGYGHTQETPQRRAEEGHRVAHRPVVAAEIARRRAVVAAKLEERIVASRARSLNSLDALANNTDADYGVRVSAHRAILADLAVDRVHKLDVAGVGGGPVIYKVRFLREGEPGSIL